METTKFTGRLTLFFFLAFIFQPSFSQTNYTPCNVITLKGDTIQGLIDYRKWDKNPGKIRFKSKLDSTHKVYSPLDITGFLVEDVAYASAVIEVETSPERINILHHSPELQLRSDTAFLQTIIEGPKSLYRYKEPKGKIQFYIKQDSSFDLLVYKKYLKRVDGAETLAERNAYIGQLSYYLNDCGSIRSKLENVGYSERSLENVLLHYYDCTQSKAEFHIKKEKFSAELGALAGLSYTFLEFRSTDPPYLVNTDYSQSLNFAAGLSCNIILPGNLNKWSLENELIFTSYSVDGQYNNVRSEDLYTNHYTEFGYAYLKLNTLFRFKYPVQNLFIYLNAGMSNGFAISETNYKRTRDVVFSNETVTEESAIPSRKYEQGLVVGLGTQFKKYSLELRFEEGTGMTDYLPSYARRYYFILGYKF